MLDLLKRFTIQDEFWGRYEKLVTEVVIPYQEKVLKDKIPGVEKSHAIDNFRAAAEKLDRGDTTGEFYGMVFQDSDVAKWLEAAAYSLLKTPDGDLERRCDEVIEWIGKAQLPDGYLNTYFTVKALEQRWTNLYEAHELYCAGHMMEAAVAYAECTGKTKLLEIMGRMADHIYQRFVEEGVEGYPGHPEVELALMKMYQYTRNTKYKELAEHFVNVRGVDSDFFVKEGERDHWTVWGHHSDNKEYAQNHLPVRSQKEAVGHAVRAVYLYSGMADVAKESKDKELGEACRTLWNNITERRMYVTGAIGSAYEGEAFTKDYHLPNDTAYAETCAAIGLIFFGRRMLALEKNNRYADTMERALYNCVLAGMQLDGTKFFYVNPLEVLPGISGEAVSHHHARPQRPEWFSCACCPPNVARLLASLGEYAWTQEETTVFSHLYIGGTLDLSETISGKLCVETKYPYDGKVTYQFEPEDTRMEMTLAVRLPGWSENTKLLLNGQTCPCNIRNGYAYITGAFTENDKVEICFDMEVKRIFASPKVSADTGKVVFSRGPFIYCAEGADNEGDVLALKVSKDATPIALLEDRLDGIWKLRIEGERIIEGAGLYTSRRPESRPCTVTLIPYYAWGNRGLNQMRVWLPEA